MLCAAINGNILISLLNLSCITLNCIYLFFFLVNEITTSGIQYIGDVLESSDVLTSVNLEGNQITEIPFVFGKATEFYALNNPLSSTFQFSSNQALLDFLREGYKSSEVTTKTVKIVFLGNGGTGKTTILNSFKPAKNNIIHFFKKKFDGTKANNLSTSTTIGIESHSGDILGVTGDITYQIWDFAGKL